MRRIPFLLLAGLLIPAAAPADEELADLLEHWAEEPLDLETATAAELSLLPWLDPTLAEAVVGLREAGGLGRTEDLLRLPGIGEERLEAIRPFLTFRSTRGRAQFLWEHRVEPGRSARIRQTLDAERGDLGLHLRRSPDGEQEWGGWIDLGALRVGRLRPSFGGGLWRAPPTARSRTAAVSPSDRLVLRGQRGSDPSAWTGLSSVHRLGTGRLLTLVGRPGTRRAWETLVAWQSGPSGRHPRWGAGLLRGGGERPSGSLWCLGPGARPSWRVEIAGPDAGRRRASMIGRWRRRPWTLGLAGTAAPAGGGDGVDPISGLRLDRPHHALQLELGLRQRLVGGVSLLWRRLRRGWPGKDRPADRVQLEGSLLRPEGRWRALLRLDREGQGWEGGQLRLRLRWEDPPRRSPARSLGVAWHQNAGGSGQRFVFGLGGGGGGLHWALRILGAGGTSPSPCIFGLPSAGVLSPWLAPGGLGFAAGVEWRGATTRLGAHAGVLLDPDGGPRPWLGVRLGGGSAP